jgi:type IV pilus assembly protein PilV
MVFPTQNQVIHPLPGGYFWPKLATWNSARVDSDSGDYFMLQLKLSAARTKGFSLIEVMIAMLVLGVGGGGLALLLMLAIQGTTQAQERSIATFQASELAQLIHANPSSLGHFMYAADESSGCTKDLPCPADGWAGHHLQQWQLAVEQSAARARGAICRDSSPLDGGPDGLACDGAGDALVKIVWQEQGRNQQTPETRRLVFPLPRP